MNWKKANEIEKLVVPGDIIQIKFGRGNFHYMLNIKDGWCVHVTPLETNIRNSNVSDLIKDATDLHQEAGSRPCRVNNFEEFAKDKNLSARSLKSTLTLSRAGLAQGPVKISGNDIPHICNNGNFSQEYCIYWKYDSDSIPNSRELDHINRVHLIFLAFVIFFAAGAALLLAFL